MQFFTMRLVAPVATIRGPVVGDGRVAVTACSIIFLAGRHDQCRAPY
jgi:hypothetical protein